MRSLLHPGAHGAVRSRGKPAACSSIAVLIPAYKPSPVLIEIVRSLAESNFLAVVVVDDGSGPEYSRLFQRILQFQQVTVLHHAMNLGKGAALKTGMTHALSACSGLSGIVTADADGQHDPADVRRVALRFSETPDALVLGSRAFEGYVPLRSRLGNTMTRAALRLMVGRRLLDTQTGLRGIPLELIRRMLLVSASGYEFELEMLVASKHLGISIIEEPVRTIYEAGNRASHFQPFRDSMRIYFVLLRFGCISLVTAAIDNIGFFALFHLSGIIAFSLAGGRLAAIAFNYPAVRKAVFFSKAQHRLALPRYLLLVAANALIAYASIALLAGAGGVRVMAAKIWTETFLFIANFAIQRDFIFTRPSGKRPAPTDARRAG